MIYQEPVAPCDPNSDPTAMPRLSRQSQLILDGFKQGRATNTELSKITLKYTSHISDLQKAGFDVRVVERDQKTGIFSYALFINDQEVS